MNETRERGPGPAADPVPILLELEEPLEPADVLDVHKLFERCGFKLFRYEGTLLYDHVGWGLIYTFPDHRRSVPAARLRGILATVREKLESEGRL